MRSSAESNWKDLGVPHDKLLFNLPASPVVEMEIVMEYEPKMIAAAFKKLIPPLEPTKNQKTLCVEHNSRWGRLIVRIYLSALPFAHRARQFLLHVPLSYGVLAQTETILARRFVEVSSSTIQRN